MHDMEVEMFGEALKDEDLLADLDKLEAAEAAGDPAERGAAEDEDNHPVSLSSRWLGLEHLPTPPEHRVLTMWISCNEFKGK